ncbi:ABC transporter permease [Promicromonospora thailandica]|uniref:Peptide/nickel transport system permease protein n=1 Tax=Promicromonospora thailandica TaxID=765201 RepID=A0A9X2G6M4_9MICO|nr:peptide/nickel transport system permease protein [Promicromonospora thailandica]BFF18208.1 ABC transporter permease [Promicromonospora thailandica]
MSGVGRSGAGRRAAGFRPTVAEALAGLVLVLLLVAAIWPGLLAPGDPLAVSRTEAFQPPSLAHVFGTDESGRDIWTRVVHGAAESLRIGALATAIGIGLATVLGLLAGLGPRWLDFGTTRLVEVLFAFPGLLLALLFIVVTGPGVLSSTIAVGLATAPGYARIIRSQVRRTASAEFVEAARVLGRGRVWIVTRHVLPNVTAALFVLATLGLGQAVIWVSSLSYLGLGAVPPAAEWGAMLAAGRTYIASFWWMTFFPGLAIVAAAAAATVLGRGIQKRNRSAS